MLTSFEDFDDAPTVRIPLETMHQLVFGEGHTAIGPDRPTRDLFPVEAIVDEVSDGIPVAIESDAATEPRLP